MTSTLFQNGLSYLLSHGMKEEKAISILKQAGRELSSLPISSNFESVFYTHLSLCLDIEAFKARNKVNENMPDFRHRRRGKPVLTLISEPNEAVKVYAVSYEER